MGIHGRIALFSCLLFLSVAVPRDSHALMGGQGLMWSVPLAPVIIRVCFLNPNDANPLPGEVATASGAQRREWLRLALKKSWEREARIVFTGWGTCADEANAASPPYTLGPRRPGVLDENVKIQITSSGGSQNPAHGSWGDYASPAVILNLHPAAPNNTKLRAEIEYLAIHEFGHVLGFYHEEERVDWPTNIAGCPRQNWPPSNPWWPVPTELRWGAPDRNSVMAYCSGRPPFIDFKDATAVQRAYGRHLPGTLLSARGSLCLSAHANAPIGERAFGWECDEAYDDQEWIYATITRSLSITQPSTGVKRCLDVKTADGVTVQTWNCTGAANQRWLFQRVLLRGYGGLCLTRGTGGAVTMQACAGLTTQFWQVTPNPEGSVRIRAEIQDVCLDASGAVGQRVRTAVCSSGRGQSLLLRSGGQLQPWDEAGICLDVRDVWNSDYVNGLGGPEPGQVVQLFSCQGPQLNQRWMLTGHVVSGNKCLSRVGNGKRNGAAAVMTTCSTSPEKDWDYLW